MATAHHNTTAADARHAVAAVLAALWVLAPKAGARFSQAHLAQRAPDLSAELIAMGLVRLHSLGFISGKGSDGHHQVTTEGAAAIAVASKGGQPVTSTTVARLWRLVRICKIVDSEAAAQTLCDAGDARFNAVRRNVQRALRGWTQAGVLEESKARVRRADTGVGSKRYVLLKDPGPAVPAFTKRAS